MSGAHHERERLRQQMLVGVLFDRHPVTPQDDAHALLGLNQALLHRGLQAYRVNARASAQRALAVSFPTVRLLIGEDAFVALARAFWHAHPPLRGDLAWLGESLPAFIDASESLSELPYLADCARLDWLLQRAELAADEKPDLASLALLAEAEPAVLQLTLSSGLSVLPSIYPLVTLWQAHQINTADLEGARAALQAGRGEVALVWRNGWRAQALAVDEATARWTQCLLRRDCLDVALAQAGGGFDFETWLSQALQCGWVVRAETVPLVF